MSQQVGEMEQSASCCKNCACARNNDIFAQEHGHGHEHDHSHSHGDGEGSMKRLAIPAILFVVGLVGDSWLTQAGLRPVFYIMMLAAYLWCGLPVLREAWETVRKWDFFNEFTLMSVATLTAIGLGEMSEAVGVMLFYSIGEALQEKASGRSRNSIKSLLASKPEKANLIAGDQIQSVAPESVETGSLILIKPGEKVPLDGIVETGVANIDMSSITGEPVPVAAEAGSIVYSGSICLDGDLTVKTTAVYSNSMVGRILAMVEDAAGKKSQTERFITRFARYYTPIVALAALLVAIVPPLFMGASWNVWIYRALVLLVVSCPCALVLSVPLVFFAAIGAMSKSGVLIKGGSVFDALLKAKTVILDKTGTITAGKPTVAEVRPASGVDAKELLHLAALAESRSNHPAARAIVKAAGDESFANAKITLRDVAGKGIVASTDAGEIAVGNPALFTELGIDLQPDNDTRLAAHIALNRKYMGSLFLEDKIKAEAPQAMRELRQSSGVRQIYMLTGDRKETAEMVSREVGLDGFEAGLLPDGKVAAFDKLSPDGTAVFVGDGVNDAPVLAKAGVGVAMGALGAAAAVEAADAVILDDSPSRLPILFKAAEKVRRVAWQNIIFALVVKTVVIIFGVAGLSGLWEAVFADVGVALLAVLNSMRMTKI